MLSENRKFERLWGRSTERLKSEQKRSDFGVIYNRTLFTTEQRASVRNPNVFGFRTFTVILNMKNTLIGRQYMNPGGRFSNLKALLSLLLTGTFQIKNSTRRENCDSGGWWISVQIPIRFVWRGRIAGLYCSYPLLNGSSIHYFSIYASDYKDKE